MPDTSLGDTEGPLGRRLAGGARRLGWDLPPAAVRVLLGYLEGLQEANARLNLTGVADPAEGVVRHVLDSLAVGLHLAAQPLPSPAAVVLDLGTGGGFPGVPVAVALPLAHVHLVDSRGRKVRAVRELCRLATIRNVTLHHARGADLAREAPALIGSCQLVLARAVAALPALVAESSALLAPGGCLVCWKSDSLPAQEREAGARAAQRAGLEGLADISYETDRTSRLVRYRRPETPS